MPSPFPGMDPYLQHPSTWHNFHIQFLVYASGMLNELLPNTYFACVEERVRIVEHGEEDRRIVPDIAVARRPEHPEVIRSEREAPATLEPVTVPWLHLDEERERFLEIHRMPENERITVIELLSPSNKVGEDRRLYLSKRNELFRQPVHLVELDLLVGGPRLPMRRPLPPGDYHALVTRTESRPDAFVYAWTVRQNLPTIPIPLRAPDADVPLVLASVFATVYDRGRLDRQVDYRGPVPAPLSPTDREWATAIAQGRDPT